MAGNPPRDPARARRLGGCAAYIVAGALLACAASEAYDAYAMGPYLARGETERPVLKYDDSGAPVGEDRLPVSVEARDAARTRAIMFAAVGLVLLGCAAWLKGPPWTEMIPAAER
jgi:hypothetical protein